MRAAVFHKAGSALTIETVAAPTPAPGQILVAVSHCGICGSDLHMTEKDGLVPSGAILGHEFAGTVVDANGTNIEAGARVTALPLFPCWTCTECRSGHLFHCASPTLVGVGASGAYAEAIVVDARLVQPLPAGVGFMEGALVEPLAVGRRMVSLAEGLRGADVLVLGGGPVGVAGIVFARIGGAGRIIVSEPNAARRAKAIEMGADVALDPTREDMAARLHSLCDGLPGIVFECVGRPGLFAEAIRLVRPRGQIVSAGASFQYDGFVPIDAVVKEVTIRFSAGYTIADFAAIVDAMARRDIAGEKMVTQTVTLAELPPRFESLRGPTDHCKVIVDIGG